MTDLAAVVRRIYAALMAGDATTLSELLAPDFEATFAAGLPHGGGVHRGPTAAIQDGWWALGRAFKVRAEPEEWIETVDGRLLVLGTYRGSVRATGRPFEAAFVHLWQERDGRLFRLKQLTDTAQWLSAGKERDD
jgi:2-(1,2-epoxy-1,2-dihydrophenyl)acetyl-CoA isomerase